METHKEKNILLVEDEKNTRHAMQLILSNAGYHVQAVENGRKALDQLFSNQNQANRIDIIVTDIQMPEMNGLELLDKLETAQHQPEIIGISGYGDREIVLSLMRHGCREFIDKPFKPRELLDIVQKVSTRLHQAKHERDLQTLHLQQENEQLLKQLAKFQPASSTPTSVPTPLPCPSTPAPSVRTQLINRSLCESGGDIAKIHKTGHEYIFFVADVPGHDKGTIHHASIINDYFNEFCQSNIDEAMFFNKLNMVLYDNGRNERLATAAILRLDLKTLQAHLFSAGHPYLICFNINPLNAISMFRPITSPESGSVLGIYPTPQIKHSEFSITHGERIFIYTDGITKVSRPNKLLGKKQYLGEKRLREFIKKNYGAALEVTTKQTWNDIMEFCRKQYHDDMLLLGIEVI